MLKFSEFAENYISIFPTGKNDEYGMPIYKDHEGNIYVDINYGQDENNPKIFTTVDGNPDLPVKKFQVNEKPA